MQTGDPAMGLTSIVAIDRDGAIGCRNALPWRLKSDLDFFRETTINNVVIMGRLTYESIGKCLPKRNNLVLSHNNVLFNSTGQCRLVTSTGEALYRSSSNKKKKRYVIGGAQTYSLFAPFVDRYLVTVVQHTVREADAFLASDIRSALSGWESRRVTEFDAIPGKNDCAGEVYEFFAPDADVREQRRIEAAEDFVNRMPRVQKARQVDESFLGIKAEPTFAFDAVN